MAAVAPSSLAGGGGMSDENLISVPGLIELRSSPGSDDLIQFYRSESEIDWRDRLLLSSNVVVDYLTSRGQQEDADNAQRQVEDIVIRRGARGQYVRRIRDEALSYLNVPADHPVKSIEVGLIHATELNACAVRTESDQTLVLLDFGITICQLFFVRAFAGLLFSRDNPPLCAHYSMDEFADAVLAACRFGVTGGLCAPELAPAMCQQHDGNGFAESMAIGSQLFLLLHEYAHVVLGHLEDSGIRSERSTAEAIIISRRQELEADAYAFMSAVEHLKKGGKDPSAFLLSPGFLLQCMYLMQFLTRSNTVPNHPTPLERWERILAIAHHEGLHMSYRYEQIAPLSEGVIMQSGGLRDIWEQQGH